MFMGLSCGVEGWSVRADTAPCVGARGAGARGLEMFGAELESSAALDGEPGDRRVEG